MCEYNLLTAFGHVEEVVSHFALRDLGICASRQEGFWNADGAAFVSLIGGDKGGIGSAGVHRVSTIGHLTTKHTRIYVRHLFLLALGCGISP